MQWAENFQLFLFDFDGLLVDTEPVHYRAFVTTLQQQGYHLSLSLSEYLRLAHSSSTGLRDYIYGAFPRLQARFPDWEDLRALKSVIYMELLETLPLQLMAGVEPLLDYLQKRQVKRCVVTHSGRKQTDAIRAKLPLLNSIPEWICREDYHQPKPDPECYLKAIELFSCPGDAIVGFEDSFKGFSALQATPAKAVLITPREDIPKGVLHFPSFEKILSITA